MLASALLVLVSSATPAWRATSPAITTTPAPQREALAPDAPGPKRRLTLPGGTEVEIDDDRGTYEVRTADGRSSGIRARNTRLALRGFELDPLVDAFEARLLPESGRVRIVQFETQVLEEYLLALAEAGAVVHRALHGQAVIATVPPAAEEEVAAIPGVRWVGPYPAEARIDADVATALLHDAHLHEPRGLAAVHATGIGDDEYLVQVMRRGLEDKERVATAVRTLSGEVLHMPAAGFLMAIRVAPDALTRIAGMDEVLWIEPKRELVAPMNRVRIDGGANYLENQTGLTGQGVTGGIIDVGLNTAHPDLQSNFPILHGANGAAGGHGTPVTGILFGDGLGSPLARGLLPDGQPVFTSIGHLLSSDRYTHTAESQLPPYEIAFESNSWGSGVTRPSYPSKAFELDDIIQLYDQITVHGQGNGGAHAGLAEAWAKNVVSVGGVHHYDTLTTTDDAWAMGGMHGPAEDGRLKPDLCYWYDDVLTIAGDSGYGDFSGTSAATPQVSGHFGLFLQTWHEELFGNVALGDSVFASKPHSATARAMLFNTALPYSFNGTQHDLTRVNQGWGRPNLRRLLDLGSNVLVVDEWRPLRNFEVARYTVVVEDGAPRLRATLVYTDLPGTSSSTMHRVNDLTLKVTSPSGIVYWGNSGLFAGNETSALGAPDVVNTTEQVWIQSPDRGVWTVEVLADEVVLDAHAETPEIDQDFALVVGPVAPIASSVGGGFAPARGPAVQPSIDFHGSLVPGAPWRIDVTNAAPRARAFLLIGDSADPRPFLGGTLVPEVDFFLSAQVAPDGSVTFEGTSSSALASGQLVRAQAVVVGRGGIAATDALELRMP